MPLFQPCAATALFLALAAPGAPPSTATYLTVQADDLASEWRKLREEFEAAQEQFFEAFNERFAGFDYEKASDAEKEEYQRFWREGQPGPKFLPRIEAFAVKAKCSDAAVEAWGMVLDIAPQTGEQAAMVRALEALTGCLESPAMAAIAEQLQYAWGVPPEKVQALLESLREKSPHRSVKAAAMFSLGALLVQGESTESKERARKLLVELSEKFADLTSGRGDRSYAQRAAGLLFELDHLQIGMVAPDMEALDVDGVKFKLSDFRGKVTVVDFWGYW